MHVFLHMTGKTQSGRPPSGFIRKDSAKAADMFSGTESQAFRLGLSGGCGGPSGGLRPRLQGAGRPALQPSPGLPAGRALPRS